MALFSQLRLVFHALFGLSARVYGSGKATLGLFSFVDKDNENGRYKATDVVMDP